MTSQVPRKKTLASAVFSRMSPAVAKIGRVIRKRIARTVASAIMTRSTPPSSHGSSREPSGRTSGHRSFPQSNRADPVDEPSLAELLGPGPQSCTVPVVPVGNVEGHRDLVGVGAVEEHSGLALEDGLE